MNRCEQHGEYVGDKCWQCVAVKLADSLERISEATYAQFQMQVPKGERFNPKKHVCPYCMRGSTADHLLRSWAFIHAESATVLREFFEGSLGKGQFDLFQDEISKWADPLFGSDKNLNGPLRHLERELVEFEKTPNGEELADCILILVHVAHRIGVSAFDECRKKFEIVKTRQWAPPDAQGVIEHIRDEK